MLLLIPMKKYTDWKLCMNSSQLLFPNSILIVPQGLVRNLNKILSLLVTGLARVDINFFKGESKLLDRVG